MRVVFVAKSTYNFSYISSIVESLKMSGCELELLFDMDWSDKKLGDSLIQFVLSSKLVNSNWLLRRSDRWRKLIFPIRELRTYLNYKKRGDQPYYEHRWAGYVPKWHRVPLPDKAFTLIEKCIPPDNKIVKDLQRRKPDVVVATPTNHRFSEEVEYIKAARFLGIPTAIIVLSWDNLTTKGLFHVIPDKVLVWNEAHKKEAINIHSVPKDRICITGAPFFDKWFEEHGIFKPLVDKPYILYLGSSRNIIKDETDLIIKTQKKYGMPLVVRAHPANTRNIKKIKGDTIFVMPTRLPESKKEQAELYSAIHHCEFAVGVNTSAMIDAIIQDKPCIAVGRNQGQTTHFNHMLPALGVDGDRKKFVRDFIRPYGKHVHAGWVASERIRELGTKIIYRSV